MKKLLFAVVLGTLHTTIGGAQRSAPAPSTLPDLPAFEVASVKVNRSKDARESMNLLPGGRIVATNAPLRRIMLTAYGLLPQQLDGVPAWIESERFDIVAQANENFTVPTPVGAPPGRVQQMFQRLLAERFNLAVHTERRELLIYELILARTDGRLGPRLSPGKIDCTALIEASLRGEGQAPTPTDCGGSRSPGRVRLRAATIGDFARGILVGLTGRIVEDRTGLPGGYDIDLQFGPDSDASTGAGDLPSLFTALEEQLGLKLRPVRGIVDVVVIDSVALPTEN